MIFPCTCGGNDVNSVNRGLVALRCGSMVGECADSPGSAEQGARGSRSGQDCVAGGVDSCRDGHDDSVDVLIT
jgi:hypothetical protein